MKFTRMLSLLLCLVMALTLLVACTDGGRDDVTTDNGDVTQAPDESTTVEATETVDPTASALPDRVFNDVFRLFTWSNQTVYEFDSDSESGKPIEDQIFYRKQYLKEKYGITIALTKENGDWDHKDSFVKMVEINQNETGDNVYDSVGCYFALSGAMSVKGLFDDLSDKEYAPYIDLSKPWWPDDLLGTAKVNGAVYAATGDITPTFIRNLSICHVNLSLLKKYNPDVDVYELVRNKEWTYEKMCELSLGKMTNTEYAITLDNNVTYDYVFYSGGFTLVENLDDGSLKLHDFDNDERFLDFYQFAYRLLAENSDTKIIDVQQSFANGYSMVHLGTGDQLQRFLANVEFDYACLPFPMYVTDNYKTQDRYYTSQTFWTTLYSITSNCTDYEIASFSLEALAEYGYKEMSPVWFEETFKTRYAETPENAEMLDIIRDSVVFDAGRIFGTQIDCFSAFRQAASGNPDWVSFFSGKRGIWTERINEINRKLG